MSDENNSHNATGINQSIPATAADVAQQGGGSKEVERVMNTGNEGKTQGDGDDAGDFGDGDGGLGGDGVGGGGSSGGDAGGESGDDGGSTDDGGGSSGGDAGDDSGDGGASTDEGGDSTGDGNNNDQSGGTGDGGTDTGTATATGVSGATIMTFTSQDMGIFVSNTVAAATQNAKSQCAQLANSASTASNWFWVGTGLTTLLLLVPGANAAALTALAASEGTSAGVLGLFSNKATQCSLDPPRDDFEEVTVFSPLPKPASLETSASQTSPEASSTIPPDVQSALDSLVSASANASHALSAITTTIERLQGATSAYNKNNKDKNAAAGILKQGAALVSNADACAAHLAAVHSAMTSNGLAEYHSQLVSQTKAIPSGTSPAQVATAISDAWSKVRGQVTTTYQLLGSDLATIDAQVQGAVQTTKSLQLTAIQGRIANLPTDAASASASTAFAGLRDGIVNAAAANRKIKGGHESGIRLPPSLRGEKERG